jgi:hypothetical protein
MKYQVTIQATITKTCIVEADDQDEAIQVANEEFDVAEIDHTNETYEQDTLEVQPLEEQES